jgi:hypothetical protein
VTHARNGVVHAVHSAARILTIVPVVIRVVGMIVTETEGETNDNRMPYFFLYYTIPIDGRQSRIMKNKISEGDDIDSIIDEIKKKNSILLASIPAYRIELYESFEQEEPLNLLEEWYPNATWGTQQQPLIVKSNPLIASLATTSPWKRNFGKCVFV